jgi:hypothetical protein
MAPNEMLWELRSIYLRPKVLARQIARLIGDPALVGRYNFRHDSVHELHGARAVRGNIIPVGADQTLNFGDG